MVINLSDTCNKCFWYSGNKCYKNVLPDKIYGTTDGESIVCSVYLNMKNVGEKMEKAVLTYGGYCGNTVNKWLELRPFKKMLARHRRTK